MIDDLLSQLRALAHAEHDDLSIADEAADEIEHLRSLVIHAVDVRKLALEGVCPACDRIRVLLSERGKR